MTPIPRPEDYDVSPENGFLPTDPPLERLSDSYYEPWEHIMANLQGLMLSKRLRGLVDGLPVLSTDRLATRAEWRRAYSLLGFICHAYIWSGKRPAERVPPPITIPLLETCQHLELPPVATYAGLCLWNWKPIFDGERSDTLANLDTISTFTGSLDEKWFYLISIAIEARGGPLIPLMLNAMQAAKSNDRKTVIQSLCTFAERLDDIGAILMRMYDECDPHVFYHRIRPFLAGSKNMADAGLPNGVVFDNGGPINKQKYVQFSGGSNAQSSLIQFFDLVLGVDHRPTGEQKTHVEQQTTTKKKAPPPNFIHEMRRYMPGPHARFLAQVDATANLREYVQTHAYDRELSLAFDACLAMLSALRDKHIQIVSRYIVIKSREASTKTTEDGTAAKKVNLAHRPKKADTSDEQAKNKKKDLTGTGGSSLIPFLRQARDETGEPAVHAWAKRVIRSRTGRKHDDDDAGDSVRQTETQGLAGVWKVGEDRGGICMF